MRRLRTDPPAIPGSWLTFAIEDLREKHPKFRNYTRASLWKVIMRSGIRTTNSKDDAERQGLEGIDLSRPRVSRVGQ